MHTMPPDGDMYLGRRAPGLELNRSSIDMGRMRQYRLDRVQEQLQASGCAAVVLMDPINRRYATGASLHSLFQFHLPSRYAIVPANGKAILFQPGGARDVPETADVVGDVRPAVVYTYYYASHRVEERARQWAAQVADFVRESGGRERRVAVDRLEPVGMHALEQAGLEVVNAQEMLEQARLIKSLDEIGCMLASISVAETGIGEMRARLKPGITENQLFAILHEANISGGGEWIEGRLLSSGGNTNPWGRESSSKMIRAGELVAFDTDMVGAFGYCADVSRTLYCPPGRPTESQCTLYKTAVEQLEFNMALIRHGLSYREFAEKAWPMPEKYRKNRYGVLVHGIGLCDEYPGIGHLQDWAERGLDGVFEENMAVCVESYIGLEGGADGVKLEEQLLVTSQGVQRLSTFPYEEMLLR
jgi:Xaa-Pro dipeptidase